LGEYDPIGVPLVLGADDVIKVTTALPLHETLASKFTPPELTTIKPPLPAGVTNVFEVMEPCATAFGILQNAVKNRTKIEILLMADNLVPDIINR
jgi:hypothetical protein